VARSPGSLLIVGHVASTLVAATSPAAARETKILRAPKVGWIVFSAVWIGASIWAQPRSDFAHEFFSYLPATYTGLYLGATGGGLLGESAAGGDPMNWGPPLAGMLVGGLLGAAAGVGLGYAASHNAGVYYTTQAAYTGIVMFTIPLINW
jgi:hypothetical protein